ncbi:MAG: alpha/beta hydrolase [Myxococcales bacterium]|nr:alpha/beta hydrolase [Myxococcales bacterium]
MQSSSFTLRARDGVEVTVHCWRPDGEVKATLQIVHGMAEHGARYARFAEAATARGFAVYADDHRGHGKTAADADTGFFAAAHGWRAVLDDLYRLSDHIVGEHSGVPRAIFGHSMGSFFTQQMLFERGEPYAAAVLSGSSSGVANPLAPIGRLVARIERARLGPRGRSALLTKLSFGHFNNAFKPARTDFDWLSRDPAEVDRYLADPRCGFEVTTQLWIDLLDALPGLAAPENLAKVPRSLPILVVSGALDPIHTGQKGLRRLVADYAKSGHDRVTLKTYPGARHELVNETNRDEISRDILDWVESNFGAAGR